MITSKEVKEAVEEIAEYHTLTNIQKAKLFGVINYIIKRSFHKDNLNEENWVEIPSDTLRTKFGFHYSRPLLKLLLENLIVEETTYSTANNKCKSYRINPALIKTGEFEFLPEELIKAKSETFLPDTSFQMYHFNPDLFLNADAKMKKNGTLRTKYITDLIHAIVYDINVDKIDKITRDKIVQILLEKYPTNEDIKKPIIGIKGKLGTIYCPTSKHVQNAKEWGKVVIQQGSNKFTMRKSVMDFIATRQLNFAVSMYSVVENLMKGKYYAKRNEVNLRLDSNLTAMHKPLFNMVCKQYNYVEIDFKNSQYAILANILHKRNIVNDDAGVFIEQAVKGKIYEYVAKSFKITRTAAKQMMMEIVFTNSTKDQTEEAKKFTELFPTVSKAIKDLKKECKDAGMNLPVYLQKIESNIVLDHIYSKLRKRFKTMFTKHDAFYCQITDKAELISEIKRLCDEINFAVSINGTFEGEIIELTNLKAA